MRIAAQAKQGFYPAHPIAVAELVKHLTCRPPDPVKKFDTINILDPCAGKGMAIRDIAVGIACPRITSTPLSLDGGRSEEIARP